MRTDSQGAFLIAAAPAGPSAVSWDGLWRNYSDGLLSPRGAHVLIINRPPGTKVKLGVTRASKIVTGEVTLGEAPQ